MSLYKVGFSTTQVKSKPNPKDPETSQFYKTLTTSFVNQELTLSDIAWNILDGYPFTVWLKEPHRKEENYLLGQHLALDFDQGTTTVESFKGDLFAQKYSTYAYPTLSSTPDKPRTRLLFVLETPIQQAANYRRAVKALMNLYGDSDPQCGDATRFFFGAGEGYGPQEPWFNCKTLPLDVVLRLVTSYEASLPAPAPQRPLDGRVREGTPSPDDEHAQAMLVYWEKKVEDTAEGNRNHTLNEASWALSEYVQKGYLTKHEVYSRLAYAAQSVNLSPREIAATITSGFRKRGLVK